MEDARGKTSFCVLLLLGGQIGKRSEGRVRDHRSGLTGVDLITTVFVVTGAFLRASRGAEEGRERRSEDDDDLWRLSLRRVKLPQISWRPAGTRSGIPHGLRVAGRYRRNLGW